MFLLRYSFSHHVIDFLQSKHGSLSCVFFCNLEAVLLIEHIWGLALIIFWELLWWILINFLLFDVHFQLYLVWSMCVVGFLVTVLKSIFLDFYSVNYFLWVFSHRPLIQGLSYLSVILLDNFGFQFSCGISAISFT